MECTGYIYPCLIFGLVGGLSFCKIHFDLLNFLDNLF